MIVADAFTGFAVLAVVVSVAIAVPAYVSNQIGDRNGRRHCWAWGVGLGWLGVAVVWAMGPTGAERERREVAQAERVAAVLRESGSVR